MPLLEVVEIRICDHPNLPYVIKPVVVVLRVLLTKTEMRTRASSGKHC